MTKYSKGLEKIFPLLQSEKKSSLPKINNGYQHVGAREAKYLKNWNDYKLREY